MEEGINKIEEEVKKNSKLLVIFFIKIIVSWTSSLNTLWEIINMIL